MILVEKNPTIQIVDNKIVENKIILDDDEGEINNCKRFGKIAGEALAWTNSLGATTNTAANTAALVVFLTSDCTDTMAPYIVTVAFAGVYNVVAIAKDFYDMRKGKRDEKKALKKEIERNTLEHKRHDELSEQMRDISKSLQNYQKGDKECLKKCITSVKKLPGAEKNSDIRDRWLSDVIQAAKDDERLKKSCEEIEKLGLEIQKIKSDLADIHKSQVNTTNEKDSKITESAHHSGKYNAKQEALLEALNDYQDEWNNFEEILQSEFDLESGLNYFGNDITCCKDGRVLTEAEMQSARRHAEPLVKGAQLTIINDDLEEI